MPVRQAAAFVPADSASWLEEEQLVLGLSFEGLSRAYPISALGPIEVLNDVVGDTPIVVTWCPLSATGAIFHGRIDGKSRRFRFHPDLHKMNLLFEDAETNSLWSQLASAAVDGPEEGNTLILLPTLQTTWSAWRQRHPETQVLRPDWGDVRFAYREPRRGTEADARGERTLALVITRGSDTRVYPFSELKRANGPVPDRIDRRPLTIHFEIGGPTAYATDDDGALIPAMVMYWKYLEDFFPEAEIWEDWRTESLLESMGSE